MKRPTKTLIAVAVAGALAPAMAQAAKVEVKISGQVNRAITFADNGLESDVLFVDNTNSGTRFRLTGGVDIGNGNKAGVRWETQYQDNASDLVDINDSDTSSAFRSRYREAWYSGTWGKVYLGQGDGSANGTSEVDFSGTSVIDFSGQDIDDGISFVSKDGTNTVKKGAIATNFDGLSRNDRVRYDTPALGPAVLSIDAGSEKFELAARINSKFDTGKLGIAMGFVDKDERSNDPTQGSTCPSAANPIRQCSEGDFEQFGISGSLLLNSGFNFTANWGRRDVDSLSEDHEGWYLKAGYRMKPHSVTISYQENEDTTTAQAQGITGDEFKRVTIAYVHAIPTGIELYAAFSGMEYNRPGEDFEDLTLFHVGTRIKF